jgi:hypothetical protein
MPPRFSFNMDLITSSVNAPKARWAKGKQEGKKNMWWLASTFCIVEVKNAFWPISHLD